MHEKGEKNEKEKGKRIRRALVRRTRMPRISTRLYHLGDALKTMHNMIIFYKQLSKQLDVCPHKE
jgi:hypothetical protein